MSTIDSGWSSDTSMPKITVKSHRKSNIRFVMLALLCASLFGNHFCFNIMQALEVPLIEELDINVTQFNYFYTGFALPNIFLAVFVGMLVDVVGVRLMFFLMCLCSTLFQVLIMVGVYYHSFVTILIGRILFGIVSEGLITTQLSFMAMWFIGK